MSEPTTEPREVGITHPANLLTLTRLVFAPLLFWFVTRMPVRAPTTISRTSIGPPMPTSPMTLSTDTVTGGVVGAPVPVRPSGGWPPEL